MPSSRRVSLSGLVAQITPPGHLGSPKIDLVPRLSATASRACAASLSALVAFSLTACSTPSPSSPAPTTSATGSTAHEQTDAASAPSVEDGFVTPRGMPDGLGSGAPDGTFPRTVAHVAGQTTITSEPASVAVLSTGQTDALLTLGIVPTGSTAADGAEVVPRYLYDAFPEDTAALDAVAPLGSRTEPNLEAVAALAPDLIVLNSANKDTAELYGTLSEIAPTVVTQGTGLYWKQDLLLLADAVGRTDQARTWLDAYHSDAAAFGATVVGDPTVSFLRTNGDRTRVFGVASFAGSVAEDSGLARPESQRFTDTTSVDIGPEQLALADGDRLFYGVQGGDLGEITSLPLWPSLSAVTEGHATSVDDDLFYLNTGPTAARGILSVLEETFQG